MNKKINFYILRDNKLINESISLEYQDIKNFTPKNFITDNVTDNFRKSFPKRSYLIFYYNDWPIYYILENNTEKFEKIYIFYEDKQKNELSRWWKEALYITERNTKEKEQEYEYLNKYTFIEIGSKGKRTFFDLIYKNHESFSFLKKREERNSFFGFPFFSKWEVKSIERRNDTEKFDDAYMKHELEEVKSEKVKKKIYKELFENNNSENNYFKEQYDYLKGSKRGECLGIYTDKLSKGEE